MRLSLTLVYAESTSSRIVCGRGTEHVQPVACPQPPEGPPAVDFPIVYCEGATLTERDGYEHGVPCWVDTWQEDPDTAATFYAGVFGWDVEKGTPPGADTRYYMCRLRGSDVAAIGSPSQAGRPPLRGHAGPATGARTCRGLAADRRQPGQAG